MHPTCTLILLRKCCRLRHNLQGDINCLSLGSAGAAANLGPRRKSMMGIHVDVHVRHMAETFWRHRELLTPSETLLSDRPLEDFDLADEDVEMIRTCPTQECEPAFRARFRELESA